MNLSHFTAPDCRGVMLGEMGSRVGGAEKRRWSKSVVGITWDNMQCLNGQITCFLSAFGAVVVSSMAISALFSLDRMS